MNFLSELQHDKNKRNGVIATVIFHLLLLLAFLLFGAGTVEETDDFEKDALTVRLAMGNSNVGSGDAPPPKSDNSEVTPEQPVTEATPSPPDVIENVETQTAPSPVAATEKTEEQPVEEPEEVNERLKNALNAFDQPNNKTGTGTGPDQLQGSIGKEDGDPNGDSNEGTRDGTGFSFKLGNNRKMLTKPHIISSHQQSGKIVVDVIVDRRGNVIKATAGAQGTTITNGAELKKAEQEVMRQKFSPSKEAGQEQRGQITFYFKLQ